MIAIQYCPCGHVDTSTDPELIKLDAERGYLDALIRPSSECDECQEERRRQYTMYTLYDIYPEEPFGHA